MKHGRTQGSGNIINLVALVETTTTRWSLEVGEDKRLLQEEHYEKYALRQ